MVYMCEHVASSCDLSESRQISHAFQVWYSDATSFCTLATGVSFPEMSLVHNAESLSTQAVIAVCKGSLPEASLPAARCVLSFSAWKTFFFCSYHVSLINHF